MEDDFGLRALYHRVAGIDVHRMLHVTTVLLEQPDGSMERQTRQFGSYRRECRALAAWMVKLKIERVVMDRTGTYGNACTPTWTMPGSPSGLSATPTGCPREPWSAR